MPPPLRKVITRLEKFPKGQLRQALQLPLAREKILRMQPVKEDVGTPILLYRLGVLLPPPPVDDGVIQLLALSTIRPYMADSFGEAEPGIRIIPSGSEPTFPLIPRFVSDPPVLHLREDDRNKNSKNTSAVPLSATKSEDRPGQSRTAESRSSLVLSEIEPDVHVNGSTWAYTSNSSEQCETFPGATGNPSSSEDSLTGASLEVLVSSSDQEESLITSAAASDLTGITADPFPQWPEALLSALSSRSSSR